MPIQIVPQPVVTPGAGDVTGGTNLTTANRVMIVAGSSEAGQSDVSLASGVFSRAGTLGLAATGANSVTIATNSITRISIGSDGVPDVFSRGIADSSKPATFEFNASPSADPTTYSRVGGLLTDFSAGAKSLFGWFSDSVPMELLTIGAQYIAFSPNSTERMRIASGGNVLIGTTTDDGSSKLQVAGTITGYSQTVYNPTAVTGVTSFVVRAGAGQSTNALVNVVANDGTTSVFKLESAKVGFFGVAPVARQTATADAASILALLQAYGLSN